MIYLDYAANTPVDENVLETFVNISKTYIANPNSTHKLGQDAKLIIEESTEKIKDILNLKQKDIIYTSGASEANNLAIKGVASQYKKYGKHIITTYLEHSSVLGAISYLSSVGYEIDYVEIDENGQVDLNSLEELIREDTILVSIACVDGEVGILQNIEDISKIISKYQHCYFHIDATQAVGKVEIDFQYVHLATFAPHKFYGLNGCGVLVKNKDMLIEPLIHGGVSTTYFRSGTPDVAMISSLEHAIRLSYNNMYARYEYIKKLNEKFRKKFQNYKNIKINSTKYSIPYILNISVTDKNSDKICEKLSENNIYVSTKSACCAPNTVSRAVFAIYKDKKRALSTIRISLSHLISFDNIDEFFKVFDNCLQ